MIAELLQALFLLLVALMGAYLVRHYIFTLTVLKNSQRNRNPARFIDASFQPSISILIPALNEEKVIGRMLQRITELTYPKDRLEVVVIDDASTDKTGSIADHYSFMYRYIRVIHRGPTEGRKGKAAALNSAFRNVNGELLLFLDADYYPQRDFAEKLVQPFIDPKVGAVQGRVTVMNEPRNVVTRLVALERIGGYRVDQQARDSLGLVVQFGGTVGGIRKSLLERLGGWDESMLAEDTDMTFRIYLKDYTVKYVEDAESYEEAVEDWHAYWRQRYRWARGHMQVAFKHSLSVLKSDKLRLRKKADGFLLSNVYFMPVLVGFSWIIGATLIFLRPQHLVAPLWVLIPISFYSFVGNFAPFFEVGIGAYLDGRTRAQWLIPLLIFVFLYNVAICTKAFADLLMARIWRRECKDCSNWEKTVHTGNGKVSPGTSNENLASDFVSKLGIDASPDYTEDGFIKADSQNLQSSSFLFYLGSTTASIVSGIWSSLRRCV